MTKISTIFLTIAIFFNFFLGATYVARGDILYDSDIARDFLLLNEIQEKKFILIGPRSGALSGFFHGPLWSYLNYPAYWLGGGNPVVVGWFWILLSGLFLLSCYYIAKKLLDQTSALIFTLLVSLRMIAIDRGFFNPIGALLLIPLFFYWLIRYRQTNKTRYLIGHILLAGALVQLQIAIGAPMIILSFLVVFYWAIRRKKDYSHLFSYLLFPLTLVTYFLFDLRHHFLMTRSVLGYLHDSSGGGLTALLSLIPDRLQLLSGTGLLFFRWPPYLQLNQTIFISMIIFLVISFFRRQKYPYLFLWFFYVGFFIFSIIQTGGMREFYYLPLFPLIFFLFVSLRRYVSPLIFVPLLLVVIVLNLKSEAGQLKSDLNVASQRQMSWQFHNHIGQTLFANAGSDFGVFIYSPDVWGYRSKYPLVYQENLNPQKKMHLYQKLSETYVVLAGSPEYPLPWGADPWGFVKNTLRIAKPPDKIWTFNDSYILARYNLDYQEQKVPFDEAANDWLTFR